MTDPLPGAASASPPDVIVAGYFPPPMTGQSVATERLASLLEPVCTVSRVSLTGSHGLTLRPDSAPTLGGAIGYLRAAWQWRADLRRHPGAAVLWTSISPRPAGHLRDVLLVQPAFAPSQRVFAVVHWGAFPDLGRPALRRSVERLMRRLTGVVFLDPSLADACAAFVPEAKRLIVPNTVADEVIAGADDLAARREATGERPLRILFLSNMLEDKGYPDVVAAVGLLQARGVAVEATFAGAWPHADEHARFDARVRESGAGMSVRYAGVVREREAIRRLMLDHDVLAFPTRYPSEAQPLVILEALACGTPVVTTASGAIPNMITDGVEGRLVPAFAPDALADALVMYGDRDRWQAASRAARDRFDRQFSPAAVRAAWMRIVDRP